MDDYSLNEFNLFKMNKLEEIAMNHYMSSCVPQAAAFFEEALEIAININDKEKILRYRRWAGASYYESGKLKQALSILAPLFQDINENNYEDYYVALIKYIECAQEIPVSLVKLQSAYKTIVSFLNETNNTSWKHMYLRKLSELFKCRGYFEKALDLAQESWFYFKNDAPNFVEDEYLSNLSHIYLINNNYTNTIEIFKTWINQPNSIPNYREILLSIRYSELNRLQNNTLESIELANRAFIIANQTDHYWGLLSALHSLCRAYLYGGYFTNAIQVYKTISKYRNSESKILEYKYHLLRGDIYFGIYIDKSGYKQIDFEYLNKNHVNVGNEDNIEYIYSIRNLSLVLNNELKKNNKGLKKHITQAYSIALKYGFEIDNLLESSNHQLQILERHKLLQSCNN